jgi:hypothetical protein
MTADQIELVRKSFDGLWPVRRKLAELFYSRFFKLAPEARRLFPDSMEKQNLKLMDALAAMVGALDRREIFQSVISHSARRHAQFGATPSRLVKRDVGFATAIWTRVHAGAERSLEHVTTQSRARWPARVVVQRMCTSRQVAIAPELRLTRTLVMRPST